MKLIINLVLLTLLVLLGFYSYNLYLDLPLENKNLTVTYKQETPQIVNASSSLEQFAKNMRFNTNRISYSFREDCDEDRRDAMKTAFNMITEQTQNIYFFETDNFDPEVGIIIQCSSAAKEVDSEQENKRTFIAGEGGPTKFFDLSPYSLILQGEIQLYTSKYATKCSEPLVELHELLHVFGYNHIDDRNSILYPYLSCDQKFKENIILDLKKLYSEPAKIELIISNISASKAGKYLNFYVEIKNTGIILAENVSLEVIAENKVVKSFEILPLDPGLMRSLELTNLQLPSSRVENITFKVKSKTPEYFLENNIIEMSL